MDSVLVKRIHYQEHKKNFHTLAKPKCEGETAKLNFSETRCLSNIDECNFNRLFTSRMFNASGECDPLRIKKELATSCKQGYAKQHRNINRTRSSQQLGYVGAIRKRLTETTDLI